MTIGDRIRNKRIELQLSQSDLAVRANYSDKTRISKIENSGNDISMKQVRRLADALGVSSAYLMGWEDSSVDNFVLQDKASELFSIYEGLSPEKKASFEAYLKFLQSQS